MLKILKNTLNKFKFQCPATKLILVIGLICLLNTIFSIFLSTSYPSSVDIAIRSVMSSIFGYVLGEHCLSNKVGNNNIQVVFAGLIAFLCLATLIILFWLDFDVTTSVVEIRNLLFSSVGFLISKAKNEENQSCE